MLGLSFNYGIYTVRLIFVVLWLSIIPLSEATIFINEIDVDTPGIDRREFIELSDGGIGNLSLSGYSLVLYNGRNHKSYRNIDLSGNKTKANGLLVICSSKALVPSCDLELTPATNFIQNGADAIALYNKKAHNIPSGSPIIYTNLIDAVVYGTHDDEDRILLTLLMPNQPQLNEASLSDATLVSSQRCPKGKAIARNTLNFIQSSPTPGHTNVCPKRTTHTLCNTPATFINEIQGAITNPKNDHSPLLNQVVDIEGIVTHISQDTKSPDGSLIKGYRGFWIQEEQAHQDGHSQTSEALFVYSKDKRISVGQKIRVRGRISEFHTVTQLTPTKGIKICSELNPLPEPVALKLPLINRLELESLEGMRVTLNQPLVISDLNLTRYGQFALSSQLLFQPTEIARPFTADYEAAKKARLLDYLVVDDGSPVHYPSFIPFPTKAGFSDTDRLRIGDKLSRLTGVLHGSKKQHFLIPDQLTIRPSPRPSQKPTSTNNANLSIAALNVQNYFNGDGKGQGFPTSRGAKTYQDFLKQTQKLAMSITALDADILGLVEIENDSFNTFSAINQLTRTINQQLPVEKRYLIIKPGLQKKIGTDEIKVSLLYRPTAIVPIGITRILDSSISPKDHKGVLFNDGKNRPSLIQSFKRDAFTFTLALNHFKSKGRRCYEENENQDGQGNCNLTRTRAAKGLAQFLTQYPTGVKTDAQLILGDLNAYTQEDPIVALKQAGFIDLFTTTKQKRQGYTYRYKGLLGALDYALATHDFSQYVIHEYVWHVNATESSLLGYPNVKSKIGSNPFRHADHEPIMIQLRLP